jgi:Transposase DDE domain
MDDEVIVTVFVISDDLLTIAGHRDHRLTQVAASEVLTVAVVAAAYFHNHHARALQVLQALGYLSGPLSVSRFNRRLHALAAWLEAILEVLGQLVSSTTTLFLLDSVPVPVCRPARARRCRKVRGKLYSGYVAATKERFFGWRLHLVCTLEGVPIRYTLLPARLHDLTPIHELLFEFPSGTRIYADKNYNCAKDEASILAATGVVLVPKRRRDMTPNLWEDKVKLRQHRLRIETLNSQLEAMGVQQLHARTQAGLELKLQASLLAVACLNAA